MNKTIQPVVIIGSMNDPHVSAIRNRLKSLGEEPHILDFQDFPSRVKISLGAKNTSINIDGKKILPACVYIRDLGQGLLSFHEDGNQQSNWQKTMVAYRERSDFVMSLVYRWEEAGVPMYNPPSTRHRVTKPFQLALLNNAGLPVPETLWSNDPNQVRRFSKGRRTAYKPIVGGASTKELVENDLTEQRLDKLSSAPVTFQTLLPGDDIRIYVINDKIAASYRIITKSLDYRQNEERVETIKLSDDVYKQCIEAAKTIGLRFTGIDLKADTGGTLRFLELNPSPMFLGFDSLAKTDILGALAQTLFNHATST